MIQESLTVPGIMWIVTILTCILGHILVFCMGPGVGTVSIPGGSGARVGRKGPVIPVMAAETQLRKLIGQYQEIICQVSVGIVTRGALHTSIVEGNRTYNRRGILQLSIAGGQSGRIIK